MLYEMSMCHFVDTYLYCCLGTSPKHHIFSFTAGEAVVRHDNMEEPVTVSLGDVLRFATGAETIPLLGFTPRRPALDFLHDPLDGKKRRYPEANTSDLVLRLPLHLVYDDFCEDMISGIVQAPSFGQAREKSAG